MQERYTPLPIGITVRERYIVEGVLDKSEFRAVYLVKDKRSNHGYFALMEVIAPEKKEWHQTSITSTRLKRLNHVALPLLYDVFYNDKGSQAYILIEYIEGSNLEELQQKQANPCFSLPQVVTLIAPIIDAIIYLHNQRPPLIHGRIKPSNIIISKTNSKVTLVGFNPFRDFNKHIPPTRYITPGYTAPERDSGSVNPRTDIYALGAVFYTLFTGTVPPDALYRSAQRSEQKPDPLVPVNQIISTAPKNIVGAIHRAMAINTHDRFSTAEQFWEALWQIADANSAMQQIPEYAAIASTEEIAELDTSPFVKIVEPSVETEKAPKSDAGIGVHQRPEAEIVPSTEVPVVAEADLVIPGVTESRERVEDTPRPIANSIASQSLQAEDEEPTEKLPVVRANPLVQTPAPLVKMEYPSPLGTADVPTTPLELPIVPQQEEILAPVFLQERQYISRGVDGRKRRGEKLLGSILSKQAFALLVLIVILLGSLGIGTSIWFYTTHHHSPISTPPSTVPQSGQTSPQSTASPNLIVTSTVVPGSSSNIARQYTGIFHDIPTGTTTNISLLHIQQQQGHISGYFDTISKNSPFNVVSRNAPFTGTINNAKRIQFIVKSDTGQSTFSFDGAILSDGSMSGTYCGSGETTEKCSDYGLWSVSPGP